MLYLSDDTDDDDEDGDYDYDNGDDSDTEEDVDSEVEGIASVFFDPADPIGFQTVPEYQTNLVGRTEGGHHTKFAGALPKKWSRVTNQIADLDVVCTDFGFEITFLTSPLSEIKVFGMYLRLLCSFKVLSVCYLLLGFIFPLQAPKTCCL